VKITHFYLCFDFTAARNRMPPMRFQSGSLCCLAALALLPPSPALAQETLRDVHPSRDPSRTAIQVYAGDRSPYRIPEDFTGKFAEHLYYNVLNGMDAQILRNPTFAEFPFSAGHMNPDGIVEFETDQNTIARRVRELATSWGWPQSSLDALVTARTDGLACFWSRLGSRHDVVVSPDTAPYGSRAQRVQVARPGEGVLQWTYLPLQRARRYTYEFFGRSPDVNSLTISLIAPGETRPCATNQITGVSTHWRKFAGTLQVPDGLPSAAACELALSCDTPGQVVIGHLFLYPADAIHGADPDIIRLLRASRLPLLRWPGGNFVSGYHWQDGVGPVERRPTRPNYAWGQVEPNLFGTDEYIEFCRAVGCEPMICVNAGSGTPDEAARWVQYCNGPVTSPMGAMRAANGHPQPYHVRRWEVGNELWGRWQFYWTTARGYVDRYKQFSAAMLQADPSIELLACGAPVFWGKQWNDTLIAGLGDSLHTITDHPLIGGDVSSRTDPLAVYRDFMAVPEVLEAKWSALRDAMLGGGVKDPHLAVTELQMFAHIAGGRNSRTTARLSDTNLVRPDTLAEGLYDVLIYHAAARLAPFVELVTHSAVVNHGGGLRKEHERVYANPCYYAQAAFAAFAGATPVRTVLETAIEHAPRVLPQLRDVTPEASYGAVDALAAIARDGSLLLSIVDRGPSRPIHLSIALDDFSAGTSAQLQTLHADVPWATNSLEHPDAVVPVDSGVPVRNGKIEFDLRPYSVLCLRVPHRVSRAPR
jgi:alpha-L-arabinofuranosidase